MVVGCKLEINDKMLQCQESHEIRFSAEETNFVDLEIEKLIKKKVIEKSQKQEGQFVSNILLRPKKDGSFRMILNLKKLNVELPF